MMKLFYAPGTVAAASLIALCETGADFDPVRLNFAGKQQTKPEYLAINPKGRVPALVTTNGIITETAAVLTYIAETNPAANLIPTDPFERAKMHEMISYLAATVHVNHAHKLRGHRWADQQSSHDDMTAKVAQNMLDCFGLIETALDKGPWIIGAQYTIADAHLYIVESWLAGDGVPLEKLPNVAAHFDRMNKRPAVQRALDIMG
ncbi:MAG: glutathione S-transferase family protein [Proteobacteria bacterium]|nr:glutathione S-transferase family protein [Pseudomonadota bacterium]